jgi:hypothetical protein
MCHSGEAIVRGSDEEMIIDILQSLWPYLLLPRSRNKVEGTEKVYHATKSRGHTRPVAVTFEARVRHIAMLARTV